jgi:hypothetical protein
MSIDYSPKPVDGCEKCTKRRVRYCIAINEPAYPFREYGECWARSTDPVWLEVDLRMPGFEPKEAV